MSVKVKPLKRIFPRTPTQTEMDPWDENGIITIKRPVLWPPKLGRNLRTMFFLAEHSVASNIQFEIEGVKYPVFITMSMYVKLNPKSRIKTEPHHHD